MQTTDTRRAAALAKDKELAEFHGIVSPFQPKPATRTELHEVEIPGMGIHHVEVEVPAFVDTGELHTVPAQAEVEGALRTRAASGIVCTTYNAIRAALVHRGHADAELRWTYNYTDGRAAPHLYVGNIDLTYRLDIKSEYTSQGRFRSVATGKVRVTVNGTGDTTSFPQKKDGTHNYAAIADKLHWYVQRKRDEAKVQTQRISNTDIALATRTCLGLKDYGDVQVSASVDGTKPVHLRITATRNVSQAAAIEIVEVLRKHGIGYYEETK